MSADLFNDIHSLASVDEDIIHIPISSTTFLLVLVLHRTHSINCNDF
jgi:hypothetical protein